jgi:ketosteroid isomerase-like protein
VGTRSTVVGVYWMDESGQRAESALYQVARMRDGRIVQLDDYRSRKRALKAARKTQRPR